jgi:glycosidase
MSQWKIYNLLVLLFTLVLSTQSQTVYTDPEFPLADSPVIVYFNASGTPLENHNGNVYTHTGVTVNGSQWQYVIGLWGNNTIQPQMIKISANLYKLVMNPTIRDFYGVPEAGNITEMCFVFRSSSSPYIQTADLFVDVFGNELSIVIQKPELSSFLSKLNDTIEISAASPLADSMFLYVNNSLIRKTEGIYLKDTILADNFGSYWTKQWVKIMAKNQTENVADSFSYIVIPPPIIEEVPAGIIDGINYLNGTSVILSLFAPFKEYVFVVGDFNDWEVNQYHFMKRAPEGDRYWLQIDNLTPGKEYAFQYYLDGRIKIGDPYCEKVLDPWNDQYIAEETYPNLKPYPAGQEGIVSVLQTNQEQYNWQNTVFEPPVVGKLVMYELLLRDFIEAHNFQTLKDTISYFKNLGINAIEIMPFSEFEGNSSWGYNPSFYFAPDKYYGTEEALKAFIDECHGNGIAVIMDMVLNHAYGQNVMARMYWDAENNRPAANNPWFNAICPHPPYCWGNDFNHESEATQAFVDRVTSYWITEYKIDGYRFDFTQGFTNSGGGPAYNPGRITLIKRMADEIWNVDPDTWVILEHWCDNNEEKELANYGCMLWGELNYAYNEATMGWNANSDFSWISHVKRGWDDPHLVGAMENHDKERMMVKNILYGNASGDYNIQDTTIALRRMELAGAFFFTVPGPKMTWQFSELGYDYWINYPGVIGEDDHRLDPKPIRWDYRNDYRRDRIHNVWQALIHLKQDYEVFSTEDFTLSLVGAFKKIHLNHNTMNVAIIGNFDVEPGTINPSLQHTGKWYNYFAGDSIDVINVTDVISLEPGEYRIYTDVKLAKPEIGLGTTETSIPGVLKSFIIYPNPSEGEFNITFKLVEKSKTELKIFDLNGQLIKTFFSRDLTAGEHIYKWNGSDLPGRKLGKGMYFVELIVNGKKEVTKLIVK